MEPQENSNVMQSSVPVNLEPKVEPVVPEKPVVEKTGKKPSKMNGMIIGMIVLVVCLVVGLTYYVLKDNGTDLLALDKQTDTTTGSETEDSSTTDSTTEEDSTESTTCEDTGTTSCEVNVDNSGWSLFTLPKYDFSVEVPSYTMTQKLGISQTSEDSIWTIGFRKDDLPHYLINYLETVDISFFPVAIPDDLGCGQGCVKEHGFKVYVYENKSMKNVTAMKDAYFQSWISAHQDEYDANAVSINGDITQKWGRDVCEYSIQTPGGSNNGYMVLSSSYLYDVSYYMSETPADSYAIAQKVLDSMKFGE